MTNILIMLYYMIGVVFTFYWYFTKYSKEITEDSQHGIISIYLISCIIFWPFKIIWDFFKKIKI